MRHPRRLHPESTTIYATTPAHAAATVNVRVTNPSGESATLTEGLRVCGAAVLQFQRRLEWLCARPSDPGQKAGRVPVPLRHGHAIHDREQRADRIRLRRFYDLFECAFTRRQQRRLLIYRRRDRTIRPNRVSRHREWNHQYDRVPRYKVGSRADSRRPAEMRVRASFARSLRRRWRSM